MAKEMRSYSLIIGKGSIQTNYATPEQIEEARVRCSNSKFLASFVTFPDGDSSGLVKATNLEQAKLILDALGLPGL